MSLPFGWHRGARTSESHSISKGFPFSTGAGWVCCGATYLCVGQRIQWSKDRIIIPPMTRHPNPEAATGSKGTTSDGGVAA
jgi:hypothetical protein